MHVCRFSFLWLVSSIARSSRREGESEQDEELDVLLMSKGAAGGE